LSYVLLANPYPVIFDDAPAKNTLKFYSKGNYKHYGSHYVPVIPYGEETSTMDFRPPAIGKVDNRFHLQVKGQSHKYDEIVVFQEPHILPKFIIHLQKKLQSIPKSTSSTSKPDDWHVPDVITWVKSLSLSQDYSKLIKDAHITGKALRTMKTKDDWKELGITVFGDVRALSSGVLELFP
jgi:hypothetical protein